MRIGIISLGGRSSLALAEACKKYFDEVDSLDIRDFDVRLTNDGTNIEHKGKDLGDNYDCLVLRGSFRYALLQRTITGTYYDKVYMPVEKRAFILAHDKFLTLVELQRNGIPIPKTHYAATTRMAKEILGKVNYPIIMKLQEGTHGKGVMIAESEKSAKTILDLLDTFKKPYIIQEFVETKQMSDIRAIVAGNKVVATYKRVAGDGEIRANIHSGGERVPHDISKVEEKLAVKAAKSVGAEICGVDIFDSKNPSVIEINLSPALHSIHEVSDGNALGAIAKYLFNRTVQFKKRKSDKMMKKIGKKAMKNSKKNGVGKKVVGFIEEIHHEIGEASKKIGSAFLPTIQSNKTASLPLDRVLNL